MVPTSPVFLAQTAGYQGADVPIGFLAVLDLRPRTGPTSHLSACFGVVVLDDADLGTPRHIVTMLIPGNRTPPSAMRRPESQRADGRATEPEPASAAGASVVDTVVPFVVRTGARP
jgi:hypothetical protein